MFIRNKVCVMLLQLIALLVKYPLLDKGNDI